MRSRVGWLLPAAAIVLTGVALWAGPNVPIALPAAALAVLAVGFLFLGAWTDSEGRKRPRVARVWEPDVFRLRTAIRSGPLVERMGLNPNLPSRTAEEMHTLTRVTPEEFRVYLRRRLDDLEDRM
jgi:hypothetical protein